MTRRLKPGTLVKICDPEELGISDCEVGLVLSLHCEANPNDLFFPNNAGYRILYDGRTVILAEWEFEVVR